MANYSLYVNSQFQPFTYQELTAPLDRAELYHEKLNEEYDKLSAQADVLEAMGANDKDKNSGSYGRYKSYSDALRREADNLYRFGLNVESRQRLSDLRRRYNTDIVPIQNAWTKREKEADEQMKAYLQNPHLMFTRDASKTSLDEYVNNPIGGYGVINGAQITAQMATMAKNLAKQIRSGYKEGIDDYTYNYILRNGLDENFIINWRKSPALSKMYQQVMEANGVTLEALEGSANANNIVSRSGRYAEMGMWDAMGEDKAHILENYGARLNAQAMKEVAVAQATAAAKAAAAGADTGNGDIPSIISDGIGMDTSEHYYAEGLKDLDTLKAGNDALKASYFGKKAGQVNPMSIYEEYQRAKKSAGFFESDAETKKKVLGKYKQYGVTDILSENQYNLLKDMGYSKDNSPSAGKARYSDIKNKFNTLVQQKNRYSVNMTKYDSVHDTLEGNIAERSNYKTLSGNVWPIEENGKLGNPIKDAKDINLYNSRNNKEGFMVDGIYYDPQYKGKIVFRVNGKRYVANASILGNEFQTLISGMEADGRFKPQHIAGALYEALNQKNKVQGETDSKI